MYATSTKCLFTKIRDTALYHDIKRHATTELAVQKEWAIHFTMNCKMPRTTKTKTQFHCGFDYIQSLPLPHITVQEIHYMRQYWVNVFFSIHYIKTSKAEIWQQTRKKERSTSHYMKCVHSSSTTFITTSLE